MKISIIMPIYNGEEHLEKSIISILKQTHENLELILINDGSKDHSLSICRDYQEQDKRVVVIDIPNSGPGCARNQGLDRATGDYISFVDADDYIKSNALEILLWITLEKDYDIVSSNHFRVHKEVVVSKNNYKTGEIRKGNNKNYNRFKTSSSFGYVWGKLYKTSFIRNNKIRFSEERKAFLEDNLFNLKAISYDPKYYVLNNPLYYYNVYEDSVSNQKEDITKRAINMLENYEAFLANKYDDNLDLFIPLGTRVLAWSLMKTMEKDLSFQVLYTRVGEFSRNKTVRRLFSNKSTYKELRKIGSLAQTLLYSFVVICIKNKLGRTLAGFFYMNNRLFKIYIKSTLKG